MEVRAITFNPETSNAVTFWEKPLFAKEEYKIDRLSLRERFENNKSILDPFLRQYILNSLNTNPSTGIRDGTVFAFMDEGHYPGDHDIVACIFKEATEWVCKWYCLEYFDLNKVCTLSEFFNR